MTTAVTQNTDEMEKILAELCSKNHTGELVYASEPGVNRRAKIRFLENADDGLFIDYPLIQGKPLSIPQGDPLIIYFCLDETRMSIDTRVIRQTRYVQNQASECRALLVQKPKIIKKSQRRSCFRLHGIHLDADEIHLSPQHNQASDEQATIEGQIKNLSETGGGLLIKRSSTKKMHTGQVYQASFHLENTKDPIVLNCELRWIENQSRNERLMAGFSWQFDPSDSQSRELQHRLAKFIMAKQLEFARRRREKD